ncbi:MAG: hypothetical protein ACMUEL_09385 [Flavobacteriales bacterium Tduv]
MECDVEDFARRMEIKKETIQRVFKILKKNSKSDIKSDYPGYFFRVKC